MATMTESEMVRHLLKEQARLQARVANLEVALHAMWAMLSHLQPPETQEGISSMMQQHFDATRDMGGLQHGTFERA